MFLCKGQANNLSCSNNLKKKVHISVKPSSRNSPFKVPRKSWIKSLQTWTWNTLSPLLSFHPPTVPVLIRIQAGRDESQYNQIEFWAAYVEVYSGSLFVHINPTDPPQNPVSTTEGSVWGPRQALTGGAILSTGKVNVCHKGTVGVTWQMLKNRYVYWTLFLCLHFFEHSQTWCITITA